MFKINYNYQSNNNLSNYLYGFVELININLLLNYNVNLIKTLTTYEISDNLINEAFGLYLFIKSISISKEFTESISIISNLDCNYNGYTDHKHKLTDINILTSDCNYYSIEFIIKYEPMYTKVNICDDFVELIISNCRMDSEECIQFICSFIDQLFLRKYVYESNGVVFIKNGSILPRNINSDLAVPFTSPITLQKKFSLPFFGDVFGMLIPRGVTIITGSGFHGKSTLLQAISSGIYMKLPGDIHEFIVTDSSAVTIRSEEGRVVKSVDISAFITNLPSQTGLTPNNFNTNSSSGSTSMAASVMEGIILESKLFLLDEDNCASNFMLLCSRMRALLSQESIIPYIYRVNSLFHELGISTIIVIGGSGDWFDVHDTALLMDNYNCRDVTERAISISKTFCTGRVQYNGRGLVHKLRWPTNVDTCIQNRKILLKSICLNDSTLEFNSISQYVKCSSYNKCIYYGNSSIDVALFISSFCTSQYLLGIGYSIAILFDYFHNLYHDNHEAWISYKEIIDSYLILKENITITRKFICLDEFIWPRSIDILLTINRLTQVVIKFK